MFYLKYVLWDEHEIDATESQLGKTQKDVDDTSENEKNLLTFFNLYCNHNF